MIALPIQVEWLSAKTRARFWSRTRPSETGCLEWTGSLAHGYGRFHIKTGIERRAHRVAYVLRHGAIDPALTVDHLCENKRCVNADHLRLVDSGVNTRAASRGQARKDRCRKGHRFTSENTLRRNGRRSCRICQRAWFRRWYHERGGAAKQAQRGTR